MAITVYSIDHDDVIKSVVLTGETTYSYALEKIFPLINRFSAQRKLQNPSFYDRLRRDILKGCIMPPITLALINPETVEFDDVNAASVYINTNIENGYVLDGMQRLNTLNSIKDDQGFPGDKKLYLSLIISANKDMLLYRMITLNNGQKPMTPRHQIEVLTEELFEFEHLEMEIQTEKERAEKIKRGSFNLADISKGYLAFFTDSVHNDNNKIISEKMDEIIVGKIMSSAVVENGLQFEDVMKLIDKFATNETAKEWLLTQNNLIGFCVGIKKSHALVNTIEAAEFGQLIEKFDKAFTGINAAKVNLGKYRRELSCKYISELEELKLLSEIDLLSYFSELTAS